ncbi:putative cytosolic protein [Granulibacter bethesdensis]|uniref:Cytosolic protein n=1 Tax=Granulibacter bethesdensis TaxID=364410 RepID=A0AAC9P874_9PROT|nr:putative cytosolic protein [Granulibacter bethesdensis]APH61795.1 putative cytosolic protein [Granulibacter bethesdensis]
MVLATLVLATLVLEGRRLSETGHYLNFVAVKSRRPLCRVHIIARSAKNSAFGGYSVSWKAIGRIWRTRGESDGHSDHWEIRVARAA